MHFSKTVALSLLVLCACGGPLKYAPKATARAPEADAAIVADVKEGQHATRLTVKVEHLAPPGRIQEGTKTYLVWQRKNSDTTWTRVAALAYDEGNREGKLEEATVPETSFQVMVTAEEKPDAASPSPHVVVEQKVNQ